MNDQPNCPGCPECKPVAGPTVAVPESGAGRTLTKEEFARLMCDSYSRYLRLPEPDRELFDAASYVAGLEHGYHEASTRGASPGETAWLVVRRLFELVLMLALLCLLIFAVLALA